MHDKAHWFVTGISQLQTASAQRLILLIGHFFLCKDGVYVVPMISSGNEMIARCLRSPQRWGDLWCRVMDSFLMWLPGVLSTQWKRIKVLFISVILGLPIYCIGDTPCSDSVTMRLHFDIIRRLAYLFDPTRYSDWLIPSRKSNPIWKDNRKRSP